jgi:hypothetical protein
MTKKIECDECHKLIDRHFVRVEFNEKELDWGLTILRGDLDFCSFTCLESWLEHKRRSVTKISEKIPGKANEKQTASLKYNHTNTFILHPFIY